MKKGNDPLRITPLGGLGEIGMNCMLLEYRDEALVIDCGLLFPDLEEFGVNTIVPNFSHLERVKDKLKGFIATHGHEDHIGALTYAMRAGIRAPIYASRFTAKMIQSRMEEAGFGDSVDIREFQLREKLTFKHFQITTEPVNHSIVESSALVIETPVGRIVHTGDFKIDPEPFYGDSINMDFFEGIGDDGVLLLLSDSTNVERTSSNVTETTIFESLEREFQKTEGLAIVTMFASNIARMGQILEIAKKTGRKIAMSGRSIEQNSRLAQEVGYLEGAGESIIRLDQVAHFDRDQVIVLASGSQGEFRSALRRIAMGEHKYVQLQPGDRVLMSSRFIPGNELAISRTINELFRQGASVLHESFHQIHVSGHATRPELERMLKMVRPKFFVPVHGEYRHLVHHAALARETGVADSNAQVAVNGSVIEITPDELKIVDQLEDLGTMVDSSGSVVSREMLRQRRKLAESGVVTCAYSVDTKTGHLQSKPGVRAAGVCPDDQAEWLTAEAVAMIEEFIKSRGPEMTHSALQEAIRIELRRFFYQNVGTKPVSLPQGIL